MLIPAAIAAGVAIVAVLGGDLGRLAQLRLRRTSWLGLAAASKVIAFGLLPLWASGLPVIATVTLHLLSYLAAAGFLWANAAVPGLPLAGAGAGLNAITITLNHGTLPASAAAMRWAGMADFAQVSPPGTVNSGVLSHPVLPWLGDVFAVPEWVPLANVFSVGDVLIVAGCLHLIVRIAGTRWSRSERPAPPQSRLSNSQVQE